MYLGEGYWGEPPALRFALRRPSGYPLQPRFLAAVRFAPHHQKNGASASIPLAAASPLARFARAYRIAALSYSVPRQRKVTPSAP
jgi:hypothetical protein